MFTRFLFFLCLLFFQGELERDLRFFVLAPGEQILKVIMGKLKLQSHYFNGRTPAIGVSLEDLFYIATRGKEFKKLECLIDGI